MWLNATNVFVYSRSGHCQKLFFIGCIRFWTKIKFMMGCLYYFIFVESCIHFALKVFELKYLFIDRGVFILFFIYHEPRITYNHYILVHHEWTRLLWKLFADYRFYVQVTDTGICILYVYYKVIRKRV